MCWHTCLTYSRKDFNHPACLSIASKGVMAVQRYLFIWAGVYGIIFGFSLMLTYPCPQNYIGLPRFTMQRHITVWSCKTVLILEISLSVWPRREFHGMCKTAFWRHGADCWLGFRNGWNCVLVQDHAFASMPLFQRVSFVMSSIIMWRVIKSRNAWYPFEPIPISLSSISVMSIQCASAYDA